MQVLFIFENLIQYSGQLHMSNRPAKSQLLYFICCWQSIRSVILECCLLYLTIISLAPTAISQPSRFSFNRYAREEGLIENVVYSILQDKKGFLWIGTNGGLSRFDGFRFTSFRHDTGMQASVSTNFVSAMCEDGENNLWLATVGGLCRFNTAAHSYQLVDLPILQKGKNTVRQILCTGNGNLLLNCRKSVFLFHPKSGAVSFLPNHNTMQSVGVNRSGNIFGYEVSGDQLIFYRFDKQLQDFMPLTSRFNIPPHEVAGLSYVDSKGNCWVSTKGDSVYKIYRLENGKWDVVCRKGFSVLRDEVRTITDDQSGRLWFATVKGVFCYYPSTREMVPALLGKSGKENFDTEICNSLYVDRKGDIWVGTFRGLYHVNCQSDRIRHFYKDGQGSGLADPIVFGLNGRHDSLCVRYLWHIPHYSVIDLKTNNTVTYPLRNNATIDPMLMQTLFKKPWFSLDTLRRHLRQGQLSNMYDPSFITFATNHEIWKLSGEGVHNLSKNILYKYSVTTSVQQKDTLWFGTADKGLYALFLQNGQIVKISKDANGGEVPSNISSLFTDDETGDLYVGTNGGGVFQYSAGFASCKVLTRKDGLSSDAVFCMVQDRKKRLWFGTDNGLCCYDPVHQTIYNFNRSDGMINTEYNRHSAALMDNGYIAMGGMDGIDYFYPDSILYQKVPTEVFISGIMIDGREVNEELLQSLSYNQNNIQLFFATTGFIDSKETLFRYKLQGIDNEWIDNGNNPMLRLAGLSPGNYRLLISAKSKTGEWSAMPAVLDFKINAPWYASWWFILLLLVVISIPCYFIYRYRQKQRAKLVKLRSKISRDLHDEVGATLTSISFLSEVTINQKEMNTLASESVIKIGELSRETISVMKDIVWAINPANDTLEKLSSRMLDYASTLLSSKSIPFVFDCEYTLNSLQLDMLQRKNLYLVFKEAVANAAKYSGCSQIVISLSKQGKSLQLIVKDNGIGLSFEKVRPGNGLINMQTRAAEMGGTLLLEGAPESGTCIRLIFPITINAD